MHLISLKSNKKIKWVLIGNDEMVWVRYRSFNEILEICPILLLTDRRIYLA